MKYTWRVNSEKNDIHCQFEYSTDTATRNGIRDILDRLDENDTIKAIKLLHVTDDNGVAFFPQ